MIPHHVVSGDGPPLVLSNSLGTSGAMWDPQVSALAARFRLIRYDHRGHGRSPVPEPPYDLADLGRDVLDLMDHLGVDRAHVGGLSLGGMVSMWLAAHAPSRVDRVALLCTAAKLGPPSMWDDRIATARSSGMASLADLVIGRWFTPTFALESPAVVAPVRDGLLATPVAGYTGCCAAIQGMDLLPVLPSVAAPTLVIAGTADVATPPEHGSLIASLIPGAKLELVDGAAHLANLSHVDTVTSLLLDFLS